MDNPLNIAFFGEDSFSNIVLTSLLKKGHHISLVVSPLYDNLIHKRLENTAITSQIEYIREKNINSETVVEKLKQAKPDLIVVAHFGKLLKKDILAIPVWGCINLHPSLLPEYRGMSPQHFPIINGEKNTGITVHFMDEGIDTGNIILQREIALNEKMYVSDLQLIWTKIYQTIMCDAIELITNGYKGTKQTSEGSYYGRLKPEQCRINPESGILSAYNLIRAVSMPYHGAFLQTEEGMLTIWRAEMVSNRPETKIGTPVTKENKKYLSFKDGTLLITKYEIKKNE